ncbi:LLM class flavin-dependent oxidoreductase [Mycoplasma miroungirhinis]|uniref:LLM class flavin-dependent oxidoreductase n=1 Tax=Mycoplasma miroungirhinis TaxID=754516 RepID=A0A6M4JCE3_9MOLU|nr:LLM class flavin-dependent oxidoreductase [Mycoplasma miroungirhinis]QJR43928.1 LLM class flavin-dependent oxidoreductase [Mycoplasma miroungirhinis]
MEIELGISSFGETTLIEGENKPLEHHKRIQNMMEEVQLADKLGVDVYAIGEHHRKDFAVSAPEIVLAAAAATTKNIKLSSAVTVISSIDPIRVYQQFSTIDAISNGRAEIMVGRGSFTESFPLFGYKLENYAKLFDEKLEMFKKINDNEILNWQGKFTHSVTNTGIYPRVANNKKLPIWIATGGTEESTYKIAKQGHFINYAIIWGNWNKWSDLISTYKKVALESGHKKENIKVATHSWGFIAETDKEAQDKYFIPTKILVDQLATEREKWRPLTYEGYLNGLGDKKPFFVGSPKTVAKKIIDFIEDLQIDRFLLHLPIGSLKHQDILKAIRLYATEVIPVVKNYFKNK